MNKIYKKKGDEISLSLDDKLKSYAREKIQKPLNSLMSFGKGSLAVLTPLAAASLISADVNAQCGAGTATFDPSAGSYSDGQVDVDGDGNPDFDFDIVGSNLYITPVGTMSVGTTGFYSVNALAYGATIDGAGSYNGTTFLTFSTTLSSGTASTVYVPITNAAGNLGFIEIQFDGAGGFTVGTNNTGIATTAGDVVAGDCGSLDGALPVALTNFDAATRNKDIALTWATSSELNNHGFEIQRSSDGINFYKLGWVEGAGTVESIMNYGYADSNVRPNVMYYYRLKQMDLDGSFEFSPVISAKVSSDKIIDIGDVYPNPASNGSINLEISTQQTSELTYELINALGQTILSQTETIAPGLNNISIATANLSNGNYFLKINALDVSEYKKIVIQK